MLVKIDSPRMLSSNCFLVDMQDLEYKFIYAPSFKLCRQTLSDCAWKFDLSSSFKSYSDPQPPFWRRLLKTSVQYTDTKYVSIQSHHCWNILNNETRWVFSKIILCIYKQQWHSQPFNPRRWTLLVYLISETIFLVFSFG